MEKQFFPFTLITSTLSATRGSRSKSEFGKIRTNLASPPPFTMVSHQQLQILEQPRPVNC